MGGNYNVLLYFVDASAPNPEGVVPCNTFKWDILLCIHNHYKSLKCRLCVSLITLWDTSRLRRIRNITVLHQIGLSFFFFVSVSVLSSAQIKNITIDNPNNPFQTKYQFSYSLHLNSLYLIYLSIGMVNACSTKWAASGHPSRLPGFPCFMSLNHHIIVCAYM